MGSKAQPGLDPVERLITILDDGPRDREFLTAYVTEVELHGQEEDVFLRLAFENATAGGAGTGPWAVSIVSELFEPLRAEQKVDVVRWWHSIMRQEANGYESLRTRLSRIR